MFPSGASNGLIEQMVENPGVPMRAPSVAVFTVDTADRYKLNEQGLRIDSAPVNDLYINKRQSVINGYFTRIALTEFNMPWDIPNVNATNNTFSIEFLGGGVEPYDPTTVSVPEAFYTGEELAVALETALNNKMTELGETAYYVFDVVFNTTSGKFTISNTIDTEWIIVPKNNGPRDDLLNMMGFSGFTTANANLPYYAYEGNVASMLYTPYFDVVSKQLTKKQQVADSGTSYNTGGNLLTRIYITSNDITTTNFETGQLGTAPFTIRREFIIPKQIYWDTKEFVNVIDLTLIDYKGNILYEAPDVIDEDQQKFSFGTGNANWQLTFQVSEV